MAINLFNGSCSSCKGFKPRCAWVQLFRAILHLPARQTIVLCEECRKLEEFRGKFLLDRRHKGKEGS